jgi:tripartite ATP-independent transporter DctM subunit
METAGLWMLAAVAVLMIATGLPAWIVLTGVAMAFVGIGVAAGVFGMDLLLALQARVVGLLDNDLLQALPLYVLMGALINRLPLADLLFRGASRGLASTRAGAPLAGLGLGVLLAPMSGSVGASVAMLTRIVQPRLRDSGLAAERNVALVCAAATLGVLIPPSLVLILLGDAMMRAHTEASHLASLHDRIVNTQDVFHGALVPGLVLVALFAGVTWHACRGMQGVRHSPLKAGEKLAALGALGAILALLVAVALGYLYAVEAAATGGMALIVYGLATRTLDRRVMADALGDTLALTGALFALLLAATFFTLVQRGFGTDRWLAAWFSALPLPTWGVLAVGLAALGACALVLDAFEMIFVVIPLLMPPLLARVHDATWVAVLTLLVLQTSFLVPPFGYAVLMARGRSSEPVTMRRLARALAPYVAAQLCVLAMALLCPQVLWREAAPPPEAPGAAEAAQRALEQQLDNPQ